MTSCSPASPGRSVSALLVAGQPGSGAGQLAGAAGTQDAGPLLRRLAGDLVVPLSSKWMSPGWGAHLTLVVLACSLALYGLLARFAAGRSAATEPRGHPQGAAPRGIVCGPSAMKHAALASLRVTGAAIGIDKKGYMPVTCCRSGDGVWTKNGVRWRQGCRRRAYTDVFTACLCSS